MKDHSRNEADLHQQRVLTYVRKILYDWNKTRGYTCPLAADDIRKELGLSSDELQRATAELERRGEVVRCQLLESNQLAYRISNKGEAAEEESREG